MLAKQGLGVFTLKNDAKAKLDVGESSYYTETCWLPSYLFMPYSEVSCSKLLRIERDLIDL